ncbi:MAG TPA: hypothetical protein P5050_01995 [Bacteroidia bacterium]|nr:hypothetical protein [Bacteroidia bacterium]HRS57975.1 hypothetical protein [Bacteroidia bacterium]HRU68570.1 hypothetical protein [Bacteroidia bacterium]
MYWYQILSLASFVVCLIIYSFILLKIIRLGKPRDYAKPSGDIQAGIKYSFTGALNPRKKESAYLHLPTYTAGLVYHAGTFLSLLLYVLSFFYLPYPDLMKIPIAVFLLISGLAGLGILIKRISLKKMRTLSNPDDYLSNVLVTSLHFLTSFFLMGYAFAVYYLLTAFLFLYLPVGKLKHSVYFFAARYHLGVFFGSRNIWPPQNA